MSLLVLAILVAVAIVCAVATVLLDNRERFTAESDQRLLAELRRLPTEEDQA